MTVYDETIADYILNQPCKLPGNNIAFERSRRVTAVINKILSAKLR